MPVRIASFPPVEPEEGNPYQRLLYQHLEPLGFELIERARFRPSWLWRNRRSVDWLHFHWPEGYYQTRAGLPGFSLLLSALLLGAFVAQLRSAQWLGYRIAWTIHQVLPHEPVSRRLARLAARSLARSSSALVAHDKTTADRARALFGATNAEIAIIPHGSYIGAYPPGRPRQEVRHELGIAPELLVFLTFGQLRGYKSVDLLLEAFSAAELPDAALVIAGPVGDPSLSERAERAAAADRRIRLLLEYVPRERVAELFEACDAVICARSDGGTSGSIILALSLARPVIAGRLPGYSELLDGERAGWLFDPGSESSLRVALERAAAERGSLVARSEAALAQAKARRWPEVASRTAVLLRTTPR